MSNEKPAGTHRHEAEQDPSVNPLDAALEHGRQKRRSARRGWWITGIAAVVAVSLGAGAWAIGSNRDEHTASGSAKKDGGTLTYLDAESSVSTQPQSAGTWQDSAYLENITDRLVWKDPKTGRIRPHIAKKWKISKDQKTYKFWIRSGVTYSDGTPLDAENVKRNLQWQAKGDKTKGIEPSTSWPGLKGIDVNDNVVTVHLATPYADFLDVLSGWASSLVADKTIDEPLEKQKQISGIIGSGPFTVEKEKYGESIVFKRRKGYAWAPEGLGQTGAAHLDRVVVRAVTDDTARLGAFQSDQADAIRYLLPSNERKLSKGKNWRVVGAQGLGATNQWFLRLSVPALKDKRIRLALRNGIDRQGVVDGLYTKNWSVAKSVVTENTFGFKDESSKLTYDPAKANELLDAAGYTKRNAKGYRTKNGKELALHTVIDVYDSTAKQLYQLIQAQLKKIGIHLVLREADYSQVSEAYAAKDVAATRSGWPYPAPWVTLRTAWSSSQTNSFKLAKPDSTLESLLKQQAVTTDADRRKQLLGELQDHVIDEGYSIPIIKDSQIFAVQNRIHDFGFTAEARPYFYTAWTAKK